MSRARWGWRQYANAAGGLVGRDLRVARRNWRAYAIRVVAQPALFVFVFAYVFPRIGQGIGGAEGSTSFSTLLVPGTLGLAVFVNGVHSIGIPLINDLGMTREVEDRIGAPVPLTFVTGVRVAAAAVEGIVAGLLVLPFALLLPSTAVELDVHPVALVPVLLLAACAGGCLGLVIGTHARLTQVQLIFSIVVLPVMFLGASYYPWASLDEIRWLQILVLVNPMVYVNEALRAATTPLIDHMPLAVSVAMVVAFVVVLFTVGTRAFARRLREMPL
jgi:ABC-2 type transport system permease protein